MRCESMSGNTERESNKCPYCDKVPMYFEIHTKDGILGWVHDKMLSHDGQRYQAEIAAYFVKKYGRHFELNRLEMKEVRCKDCGTIPKDAAEVQWERFKELAANGLLLIPPEGGW